MRNDVSGQAKGDSAGPEGQSVSIKTSSGSVFGTLLVPDGSAPYPIVVLVSGSGPTDRDGNTRGLSGENNSLLLLANELQKAGIASLRYDKRGVGESVMPISESDLRVDTFAVDAAAWVRSLRDDDRFSRLFLAGHSEGALLAAMAAKTTVVDGVISIDGAGQPADQLLREQLSGKLPDELSAAADTILAKLEAGKTTTEVPAALMPLFRPSVQPYLMSWFALDPAKVLGGVNAPKLILQGETDIQVSVSDAKRLAEFSPAAKLAVIPGMNHVLKDVPDDRSQQIASYTDPTLPVDSTLVSEIVRFVETVSVGRKE